jgi:hypothetical protein
MNKFQLLSTYFLIGACSVFFSAHAVDDNPPSDTLTVGLNLINPCAIFDTRASQSGRQQPLDSGETMHVDTIMNNYASQGGVNGSCGLPPANRAGEHGGTAAVLLNLVALNTTDAGNLRAWDPDDGAPDGGIMIYNAGQSNNVVVPLKIADSTGQNDDGGGLYIENNGSWPLDVRGVLLGYYTDLVWQDAEDDPPAPTPAVQSIYAENAVLTCGSNSYLDDVVTSFTLVNDSDHALSEIEIEMIYYASEKPLPMTYAASYEPAGGITGPNSTIHLDLAPNSFSDFSKAASPYCNNRSNTLVVNILQAFDASGNGLLDNSD